MILEKLPDIGLIEKARYVVNGNDLHVFLDPTDRDPTIVRHGAHFSPVVGGPKYVWDATNKTILREDALPDVGHATLSTVSDQTTRDAATPALTTKLGTFLSDLPSTNTNLALRTELEKQLKDAATLADARALNERLDVLIKLNSDLRTATTTLTPKLNDFVSTLLSTDSDRALRTELEKQLKDAATLADARALNERLDVLIKLNSDLRTATTTLTPKLNDFVSTLLSTDSDRALRTELEKQLKDAATLADARALNERLDVLIKLNSDLRTATTTLTTNIDNFIKGLSPTEANLTLSADLKTRLKAVNTPEAALELTDHLDDLIKLSSDLRTATTTLTPKLNAFVSTLPNNESNRTLRTELEKQLKGAATQADVQKLDERLDSLTKLNAEVGTAVAGLRAKLAALLVGTRDTPGIQGMRVGIEAKINNVKTPEEARALDELLEKFRGDPIDRLQRDV